MAKCGSGAPQGLTERLTVRASENHCEPSGSSTICVMIWPGVLKVPWTFHRGQVPPKWENGKRPEEKRFETLPAESTRTRKKGMPRAAGRTSVVNLCATCSKLAPKRAPRISTS